MSFPHFIARRILVDKDRTEGFSRPIVVIAVWGIIIGMAVMILTVGITKGFQREVRAKVIGVGGHLQISAIQQVDPKETPRVAIDQPFYPWLDTVPGVQHIQVYATRPGIIETDEDIQGVVLKGIGKDHDPGFLEAHLLSGSLPTHADSTRTNDMLISGYLSRRLRIGLQDTVTVYLIKGQDEIRPRKFRVCGLYETGLEQMDHQMVFVDIDHLQRFAQWGLKAEIAVSDSTRHGLVRIEGRAFGGDRLHTFNWPGRDWVGPGPHWLTLPPSRSELVHLVVGDHDATIPDSAWVEIQGNGTGPNAPVSVLERGGSGGSHVKYCGGFEVELEEHADLRTMDDLIYREYLDMDLRCVNVQDRYPEIFAWLELLDTNVVVIIALMVIVAIINMTSALLIIILERTRMVGVLKALGCTNAAIRRIFLIDAAYILGIGILLGDVLGIGLCLLQGHFGIVRLPVESYYVDEVPVLLDGLSIILLNAGTMLLCVMALVLPSLLVTRIAPAKAISFK